MLPLRDTVRSKTYPIVNTSLIGLNLVLFLVQQAQGGNLERFIYYYGLVPARYSVPEISAYFTFGQQILPFFSFMFLHGGWLHLIGNMWSLFIFGDNVEDHLGPARYLLFYLLSGVISGLTHFIFNPLSTASTIGASGAVAGVMGAYILLHPGSRILTLIPIFFIPWFVEIPAVFFLGIWFLIQFFNAAGSGGQVGGVAWWAHVGGFLFGMVCLKILDRTPRAGISQKLRKMTARKTSERFQSVSPNGGGPGDSPHLYAAIRITPHEVLAGTRKLVNVPWGFQKRLVRVTVPPGTREGSVLRLKGLGKSLADGTRGDLYLRVTVDSIYRTVS